MTLRVPRQQIPLLDRDSGQVSRAWYEAFHSLASSVETLTTEDVLLVTLMLHVGLKAIVL